MKKILVIAVLLGIIGSFLSFGLLYISLNLISSQNFVNQNLRKKLAENIFLRSTLRLHQLGDAKSDFAKDNNFKSLEIRVFSTEGEGLPEDVKQSIIREIEKVVQKPEGVTTKDESLEENNGEVNDDNILILIKNHPVHLKDKAILQIFLLKKYAPVPTYAGLVKDAYNIFVFKDAMLDISTFEKTSNNAEISTILHEFAHLLEAGHVDDDTCILSAKVEDMTSGRPKEILTSYCPQDLEEIQKAISL